MLISSIHKSLQRHVAEILDEIKNSLGAVDLEYWSFENRADEDELPKASVIGLSGFEFHENKGLWVIRAAIGFSPYEDRNLDFHVRSLDIIYNAVKEGQKVSLLHSNTGELISELVVSDFHISPVGTSELRTYRTISFELLRTDTAEPS